MQLQSRWEIWREKTLERAPAPLATQINNTKVVPVTVKGDITGREFSHDKRSYLSPWADPRRSCNKDMGPKLGHIQDTGRGHPANVDQEPTNSTLNLIVPHRPSVVSRSPSSSPSTISIGSSVDGLRKRTASLKRGEGGSPKVRVILLFTTPALTELENLSIY